MAEVLLPDVEEMLWRFAQSRMTVPVFVTVPEKRPKEFLTVQRIGGGAANMILDLPVVIGQGWAGSKARAGEIAAEFRNLMVKHYTDIPLVRGVQVEASPYSDPDPESGSPRYTVRLSMRVRAGVA